MSRPDEFPEDEFYEEAEEGCDGVVECTALVLAEGCTEMDGRVTLFGVMDELRISGEETSFVVYAKFEGCDHAAGEQRWARLVVSDDEGGVLQESEEYRMALAGAEEPATLMVRFELPAATADGERVLWVEAVLDEETLAQTAVRVQSQYSV